jgi:hypothetical protein
LLHFLNVVLEMSILHFGAFKILIFCSPPRRKLLPRQLLRELQRPLPRKKLLSLLLL